jgi:GMP synthase-like glutamine amidotransferase
MRICVLDLTTHPEPLLAGKPRVGAQIIDWLSPALPEATFTSVGVAQEGAPLPAVADFDGLLLSGSEFGVYDDLPWMKPLRQFLHDVRAAGKPIFGICFGHQLMADTFGGKAEKAAVGQHVGARQFEVRGQTLDAHVWHKDQVTQIPPGAKVIGSAPYCPVAALEYDFPAASIQFHPEYRDAHLRELWQIFGDKVMSQDERIEAMRTLDVASVAVDLQARETAAFFRSHHQNQSR